MIDYDELRALLAAGTSTPWLIGTAEGAWKKDPNEIGVASRYIASVGLKAFPDETDGPDAALIVGAVNALEDLLDENYKLRVALRRNRVSSRNGWKQVEKLKEEITRLQAHEVVYCKGCSIHDYKPGRHMGGVAIV